MRIQPRQQLLEIWHAIARSAFVGGEWAWGGRHERNSISDAEQLLCILGPESEIPTFKLGSPDETADDVLASLRPVGDSVEIPRQLVKVLAEYFTTYTDEGGTPTFAGGSYFTSQGGPQPTEAQRELAVVDSFSVSVRLSLATIGFVKVFRNVVTRPTLRNAINDLEAMASKRLSAAMIGLLRSFTVSVWDVDSEEGRNILWMANGGQDPTKHFVEDVHQELREIKAGLRDITLGSGQVSDLDNENKLFECGWSWGIVKDAPKVDTVADVGEQAPGVAFDAPYLYFTVVALDCIQYLFSDRTRLLGLLDEEQQRLARSLQLRWDLTQGYWSRIALFGSGSRWPLANLPWRTSDGVESDYFSLLVTAIVVDDVAKRKLTEQEGIRVAGILEELAGRVRITRRPLPGDLALQMHNPGYPFDLDESEEVGGPRLCWRLADFAPQLLKQTLRIAVALRQVDLRGTVADLADRVWQEHLMQRRIAAGPAAQLWDLTTWPDAKAAPVEDQPSWYFTERVTQCLVAAATLLRSAPLRSQGLTTIATDMLAEADHLFDQELLGVSAEQGPAMSEALGSARAKLLRAHEVLRERPGTAFVLASDVLRQIDDLVTARDNAAWTG